MDYSKNFGRYLLIEKGRAVRTIDGYTSDVRRFRSWLDANPVSGVPVSWEEVAPRHIRAYLNSLEASPTYVLPDHLVTAGLVWLPARGRGVDPFEPGC